MKFDELKQRAEKINHNESVRLSPGVIVDDPMKMISTHIAIIEAAQKRPKKRVFSPYFERLEALVLHIEKKSVS